MKNSIILLLFIGLISNSCEKIIDINVPDKSRKIVLNSLIDPGNEVSLSLTQSKSILEDNILLVLKDAEPQLFENDILVGTLNYLGSDKYSLPDFFPSVGKDYKLVVNHQLLQSAEAEVSIPRIVDIVDIDTTSTIGEWGQKTFQINVEIDDPSNVKNYYALSMSISTRIYDWESEGYLDSLETHNTYIRVLSEVDNEFGDNLLENDLSFFIDDKLFFSDDIFVGQGETKELALEYYLYSFGDSILVDLRLDHIDPSYFYHSISKEKYYRTNGNPFAEPVQVYSNVQNGFGLLSSFSRTSRKYKIFVEGDK